MAATRLLLILFLTLVLVLGPQALAGHVARARFRAERLVCCPAATDKTKTQDSIPESLEPIIPARSGASASGRCCGKGWGLHCCEGEFCCLDEEVVPRPDWGPGPVTGSPQQRPATRLRGSFWDMKDWAEWFNLAVVILVVALVCAVLVCFCRTDWNARQQRLLNEQGIYSYGSLTGHPSAPHWNSQHVSRWVDFSQKPTVGTPLTDHTSPYYLSSGLRASQNYPGLRRM